MRHADLLGHRIARRYELVARLGDGRAGVCFAARDRDGREVIAKVIERSRVSDEAVSRFIQTASALAGVQSAHLVTTLDVAHDLDRGLLVIVREPMRGIDLSTVLEYAAPMDPRGALAIAIQACAAAAAAHAAGVLLLGIKPTNVFLDPGPEIAVRICDPAVAPQLVVGANCVAPELSSEHAEPDERCDVYSLGALLYTLLTGIAPRGGARVRDDAPWIEPGVAHIVDAALADRASRTVKAAELGDALREITHGDEVVRPTMLVPIGAEARARRGAQRAQSTTESATDERRERDPLIGRKLGGHYTIVGALGRGGMGSVYEVVSADGEKLAAKIVLRTDEGQTHLFARFLREAQAATKIVDRHVVRTVELGTDMALGAPFMVMELLRGRDLASVLREHGALEPIIAARIFVQAARGLAAAHRFGVIHRDVKPANVFLDTNERGEVTVKICDFGLAKSIATEKGGGSDLTHAGAIIGTPSYMSPEHATGARDIDARSDLWSLCASLYEALSGQRLWASYSATGSELLHIICTRPFRPLDQVAPHVPAELVAIVHRGLEHERRARWQDAASLADALHAFVGDTERVTLGDLRSAAATTTPSQPMGHSSTALAPLPLDQSTQAFEQSLARGPRVPNAGTDPRESPQPSPRKLRRAALAVGGVVLLGAAVIAGIKSPRNGTSAISPSVSVSASPSAQTCASNAQCTRDLARAAICDAARACVPLESDDCVVRGPSGAPAEGTIWIGMMFPRAGEGFETLWAPAAQTVELAVRDVNEMLGGIPDPRPGKPARPLGLIACDDSDDARATRAARHLAEDVRVSAVIGFRSSNELITLAGSEFLPHGVLAIATFNKSSLVSSIPHPEGSPRLVWRLAPSNAQDAAPLSAVIADIIEPELRAGALGARTPMRVTVVRPDSATGVGFEDGLLARLRFNGKSLADNRENFQELVFDERSADPISAFIDKLVAFGPHVIAYAGDGIAARLPDAVERRWSTGTRPRYLFGGPLQDEALQRLVEKRPELARRFIGISTPASVIPNVKLAAHFNQVFGANQTATTTTPNAYDAVYLLAYAAIASGEDSVTGVGLARGIDRLMPPGDALEIGPAHVLEAYNALRAGKRIDLFGASGPLDFDTTTGEARFDYVFECLAVTDGRARRAETALRIEPRTQRAVGTLTCR